jgi:hypothetical protein
MNATNLCVKSDFLADRQELTTTRKQKYLVIKDSSKPVYFGMPSNLARSLKTIGRSAMRTASKTGGRIP